MFKKITFLFVIICCFFVLSAASSAAVSAQHDNIKSESSDTIQLTPNGLYTYGWRVSSVIDYAYFEFGDWRIGPSDVGPGELHTKNSHSMDRRVSVDITGKYHIGAETIGQILGVQIGSSQIYDGSNYTIPLAAGKRKTIWFRPKYKVTSVESQYVRINNLTGAMNILKTETAYVKTFTDWDYNWIGN